MVLAAVMEVKRMEPVMVLEDQEAPVTGARSLFAQVER